jgi:hypothetical protein
MIGSFCFPPACSIMEGNYIAEVTISQIMLRGLEEIRIFFLTQTMPVFIPDLS